MRIALHLLGVEILALELGPHPEQQHAPQVYDRHGGQFEIGFVPAMSGDIDNKRSSREPS